MKTKMKTAVLALGMALSTQAFAAHYDLPPQTNGMAVVLHNVDVAFDDAGSYLGIVTFDSSLMYSKLNATNPDPTMTGLLSSANSNTGYPLAGGGFATRITLQYDSSLNQWVTQQYTNQPGVPVAQQMPVRIARNMHILLNQFGQFVGAGASGINQNRPVAIAEAMPGNPVLVASIISSGSLLPLGGILFGWEWYEVWRNKDLIACGWILM